MGEVFITRRGGGSGGGSENYPVPIGTPLNDCTWEQISQIAGMGLAPTFFAVGDRKGILVNGQVGAEDEHNSGVYNRTLYVYILGFDHNGASNCIDFGTFMTKAVDEIGDPDDGYDPYWGTSVSLSNGDYQDTYTDGTKYYTMNHWGSYNHGGWKGCDLRYDILGSTDVAPSGYGAAVTAGRTGYDATPTCATNPVPNTLMAALPSDLRAVMKPMMIYTDNVGGTYEPDWESEYPEQEALKAIAKDATVSIDYLPLLSPVELIDWTDSANPAEMNYQKQYAYYAAGNILEKGDINNHYEGNPTYWWLRSPAKSLEWYIYDSMFAMVDMHSLTADVAGRNIGIAPIFRV